MRSGVHLIGHRGAPARAPENTLASLRRALVDGADGVEFDVRVLRDGTAVLMHDDAVDRTTNGIGALADFDRAALEGLTVGEIPPAGRSGEPVPVLEDVLDELFGRTLLVIELKDSLPAPAFEALAGRHRENRDAETLLASFEIDYLAQARDLLPSAPRALVLHADQALPDESLLAPLGLAAVFARHENVDERFVVDLRRRGLAAWAYTVNDPGTAARLVAAGASGIISDDPGTIRTAIPPLD